MPVWDLLVRLTHWSLASTVIAVWTTGHRFHPLHHELGYAAAGIVLLRIVWGFIGTRHARFADFVRGPSSTWRYATSLLRGAEPDHLGHYPLGGWMILALLTTVVNNRPRQTLDWNTPLQTFALTLANAHRAPASIQ